FPGEWYCHFVYPKHVASMVNCWVYSKKINSDGSIDFNYSYHNSRTKQHYTGEGKIHKQNNSFTYKFYGIEDSHHAGEYHLLATDHQQFVVFGGCPHKWDRTPKVSWIDFRDKVPSKTAIDAAAKAVKKLGLDISDYETV
ncbi:hypothetical protein L9F63_027024, partial [Diploptera punctata]